MTINISRRTLTVVLAALAALAAIVLVYFVLDPFGKSVSDRVSDDFGSPAKCKLLGLAEIAGERTKVYGCAVRELGGIVGDAVICRAVIDGHVYHVSDAEYRGCNEDL